MTEAERLVETFQAARQHADYQRAMSTPPVTWLTAAVVVVLVLALSIGLTVHFYPWDDLERMPPALKGVMMFSWLPTIGGIVVALWLLFDAASLAMRPTRRELAVIGHRADTPAPYFIRLIGEDGRDREYRARRRAASVVKLRLLTPGDVGVAIFKGDVCVEWVQLPLHPDRAYDRR